MKGTCDYTFIYYSLSVRRSKEAISFSKSPVGRKPQPIGSYCWKVLIACWRLASFSWIRHVSLEKNTVKCVSDPRTHTGDLGFFKFQPTLNPKSLHDIWWNDIFKDIYQVLHSIGGIPWWSRSQLLTGAEFHEELILLGLCFHRRHSRWLFHSAVDWSNSGY